MDSSKLVLLRGKLCSMLPWNFCIQFSSVNIHCQGVVDKDIEVDHIAGPRCTCAACAACAYDTFSGENL